MAPGWSGSPPRNHILSAIRPPKPVIWDCKSVIFRKSVTNVFQFRNVNVTPLKRSRCFSLNCHPYYATQQLLQPSGRQCWLHHPKVKRLQGRPFVWTSLAIVSRVRNVTVTPLQRKQYLFVKLSPLSCKQSLVLSSEVQFLIKLPKVTRLHVRSVFFWKTVTNIAQFRNVIVTALHWNQHLFFKLSIASCPPPFLEPSKLNKRPNVWQFRNVIVTLLQPSPYQYFNLSSHSIQTYHS